MDALAIPPIWVTIAALIAAWRCLVHFRQQRQPLSAMSFVIRISVAIIYLLSAFGVMDLATRSVLARWSLFVVLVIEALSEWAALLIEGEVRRKP